MVQMIKRNIASPADRVQAGPSYPTGPISPGPGPPNLRGPNRDFDLKPHFGGILQFDMSNHNCALRDSLVQRTMAPIPEPSPHGGTISLPLRRLCVQRGVSWQLYLHTHPRLTVTSRSVNQSINIYGGKASQLCKTCDVCSVLLILLWYRQLTL